MRLFVILIISLSILSSSAYSQSSDNIKQHLLSALSTPLPITVIGPLISRDVVVVKEGSGFRATLDDALLMGIVPLGTLSFKLTPEGSDGDFRVTELALPKRLDIFNAVTLGIDSTEFNGVWSTKTRSYKTLNFQLNNVTILPRDLQGASVQLGTFALNVDKEGESGARDSRFSLSASNIASVGMPTDNISIQSVVAELKADGKEPVDLYALLSRFIVLSAIQKDQNALLSFAESLRVKEYDAVSMQVALNGLALSPKQPNSGQGLTVGNVNATMGIVDMSPREWGEFVLSVTGSGINSVGYADTRVMKVDDVIYSLSGDQIPIGATMAALSNLDAMSRGQKVSMKATDLIDAFLNFGRIEQVADLKGITFIPVDVHQPQIQIGSYYTGFGLKGFRDKKGRVEFKVGGSGFNILPKSFPDALSARVFQTLNPKQFSYDFIVSDLNEGFLRKLVDGLIISDDASFAALAAPGVAYAMAMKPVVETKDARFVSSEIDVSASGKVRVYPAWMLSALSYEGESQLTMSGFDKLARLLQDIDTGEGFSDEAVMPIINGILGTMKALSKSNGDRLVWDIKYPEAGVPLLEINDIELRFPNVAQFMPMISAASVAESVPEVLNLPKGHD